MLPQEKYSFCDPEPFLQLVVNICSDCSCSIFSHQKLYCVAEDIGRSLRVVFNLLFESETIKDHISSEVVGVAEVDPLMSTSKVTSPDPSSAPPLRPEFAGVTIDVMSPRATMSDSE